MTSQKARKAQKALNVFNVLNVFSAALLLASAPLSAQAFGGDSSKKPETVVAKTAAETGGKRILPVISEPVVIYFHGLYSNSAEPFCLPGGKKGLIFNAFKLNSPSLEMKSFEYDNGKVITGDYADLVQQFDSCVKDFGINNRRIILVGVSLGGYAMFQMYNKLSDSAKDLVAGAICVGCPENLDTCFRKTRSGPVLDVYKSFDGQLADKSISKQLAAGRVPPVVVFVRFHEDTSVPHAANRALIPFMKKKGANCLEIEIEDKHGIPSQLNLEHAYQQFKALANNTPGL
ncbi:MAG: hypothetical protein BWY75_03016 [bacterium ADurb.Bin425]|jgi:pimeloyl-ACP methyl ester carboxylesterase|nr:MAG: hypothetical protein BWY75_03016 [bacterium ADurb.Bin425]